MEKVIPPNELLNVKQPSLQYQSLFCKNHSMDSSLSYLADIVSAGFDSVLLNRIILIDLQKPLDTKNVPLKKMFSLRFSNKLINWLDP